MISETIAMFSYFGEFQRVSAIINHKERIMYVITIGDQAANCGNGNIEHCKQTYYLKEGKEVFKVLKTVVWISQ